MNPREIYRRFGDVLGDAPVHPQFFSKRFLKKRIASAAAEVEGTVLDLGCGRGPYRKFFSKGDYIGLDRPGPAASTGPDVWADVRDLPLAPASVDAALMSQVLEHVDRPEKALAETARVLKPGGRLLLTAPFFYPLHDEPHDYYRYSPHGLKALLDRAGFEVLESTPQGGFIPLVGEMINLYGLHKINNLLQKGLWGKMAGTALAPFFLVWAFVVNIVCLVLSPLDRDRRFVMNYFIIARRR